MTTPADTAAALRTVALRPDPGNPRTVHRNPWMHLVDVVTWPLAFLLDRNDRPSTSKFMAFAILGAFALGKAIPVAVVIALLAASFGYTAWKDFVAKGSWGVQSTDAVSLAAKLERSEHIEHTITEQRGPTGEPLRSLPPKVGATMPSGEP